VKIDLIGMILNTAGRLHFDGLITDDNGKELDPVHSLDFMIMEYAKVRNGGESSSVAIPNSFKQTATPL
jgi:hypothetical protein